MSTAGRAEGESEVGTAARKEEVEVLDTELIAVTETGAVEDPEAEAVLFGEEAVPEYVVMLKARNVAVLEAAAVFVGAMLVSGKVEPDKVGVAVVLLVADDVPDDVALAVAEEVGNNMQLDAAMPEDVPLGHCKHIVLPAALYVFTSHATHESCESAPNEALAVPAGQRRHAVAP